MVTALTDTRALGGRRMPATRAVPVAVRIAGVAIRCQAACAAGIAVLLIALTGTSWAREATASGAADNDPTRPPERVLKQQQAAPGAVKESQPSLADPTKLVLQAIMRPQGRPATIMVDGWLYRTGDIVHGCKLISIQQDSADFILEGQKLRVSLTPQVSVAAVKITEPAAATAAKPAPVPARPMPKERP